VRLGAVLALALGVALVTSPAAADAGALLPRPIQNGAYVDLYGSYERDYNRFGSRPIRWTDVFFREKLTVYSDGYFYHPRFLVYHAALGGALKQESYESTYLGSLGWKRGTGVEYDVRLVLLPEHSYNVDLFARRYEPLFKEQSATQRNSVQTSWGGGFKYRKNPLFFHARYQDDTVRSNVTTSIVERFSTGAQYSRWLEGGVKFSLMGEYNPTQFSDNYGLNGESEEVLVAGSLDVPWARLSVSANQSTRDQESPASGTIATDQESFYESLVLYLPLRFRNEISYRYYDSDSVLEGRLDPTEETLSDRGEEFRFDVFHYLYDSLNTIYRFRRGERRSASGESEDVSNSLSVTYTKLIPQGRLIAGANVGRLETENSGQLDVVSEPHPSSPVPGVFVLGQANANRASVEVFLRSPLPPFETIRLFEGIHYTITPLAATFEVAVFSLPPQFAIPGTYDLIASYSLLAGAFELRSDAVGYNLSVEMFGNLLTPYYSYVGVRSETLAGVFPGEPIDSTTNTVGILFQRGPWRARTEYLILDWDVSPYRTWRNELQYVGSISPTTSVYATGAYVNRYHEQGTAAAYRDAYGEGTLSASGSVQKRFRDEGLLLAAGAAFSRLNGLVDTNAFSVNSTATWKIGRLDVTVGASVYGSQTTGYSYSAVRTERAHEYYYVTLRRYL
jgi:hypothetical protein